jgi:hypothetical protein
MIDSLCWITVCTQQRYGRKLTSVVKNGFVLRPPYWLWIEACCLREFAHSLTGTISCGDAFNNNRVPSTSWSGRIQGFKWKDKLNLTMVVDVLQQRIKIQKHSKNLLTTSTFLWHTQTRVGMRTYWLKVHIESRDHWNDEDTLPIYQKKNFQLSVRVINDICKMA